MSDFFDLYELMENEYNNFGKTDILDLGTGAPVVTKALEAPGDDFPEPPVSSDSDFPEPPVSNDEPDDYDTTLDAANQEIEDAGNAAVSEDFPDPPVSEDEEDGDEEQMIDDEETTEPEISEVEETSSEDPMIEYKKVTRIHSNMKRLLAIIQNSRDSFEQKFSSKINGDQYAAYHKIINTFEDLYGVTERVLTTEFTNCTYIILLFVVL